MEEPTALITVPLSKLNSVLKKINESSLDDDQKMKYKKLFSIYRSSNIPVDFWNKSFANTDNSQLSNIYKIYSESIDSSFANGTSLLIAGQHGVGKTFLTTNILKHAVKLNYKSLYTDLGSIVSCMTTSMANDKFIAKQNLLMTDFLVIDEVDDRFAISTLSSDLYFSTLESIIRPRIHNNLPILICTNSPNILKSLKPGTLQTSLESLFNKLDSYSIIGEDKRKQC